jgi:hypothetical protein
MRAERFVVRHKPEHATRDRLVRDRLVAHSAELIDGFDAWPASRRGRAGRHVEDQVPAPHPSGLLRVDRGAVTRESRFVSQARSSTVALLI